MCEGIINEMLFELRREWAKVPLMGAFSLPLKTSVDEHWDYLADAAIVQRYTRARHRTYDWIEGYSRV